MSQIALGNTWLHSALLGAGFSKNWGGYLASEMVGAMLSDPLIEGSPRLRQLLLQELDFEVALAEVRARRDRYSDGERAAFETVVRNAFELHDQNLRHKLGDVGGAAPLWQDFYDTMLQPLLEAPQRKRRTFLFSLNQDLFIERALCRYQATPPRLPAVSWNYSYDPRWFPTATGQWHLDPLDAQKDIARVETEGFDRQQFGGGVMNFIKLHGSYNWRNDLPDEGVMVLGGAKDVSIARHPILSFYFDIFREICSTKDMRLLIVGYSFRDAHVNEPIMDGVRSNDLKLFIIDPKPPAELRSQLVLGRYGDIWKGVHGYVSRPISEVFGRTGRENRRSGEAVQIRSAFYRGAFD